MITTYSEFGKKLAEFCSDMECASCQFFDVTSGCTFRDACDDAFLVT